MEKRKEKFVMFGFLTPEMSEVRNLPVLESSTSLIISCLPAKDIFDSFMKQHA